MVPNLLKPNFKRGVEGGDERDGLLTGTLGNSKEASLILSGSELGCHRRVFLGGLFGGRVWLVKGGERLRD